MQLEGAILEIKARQAASGDVIQSLKLEVHGDFAALHALVKKPLRITLSEF